MTVKAKSFDPLPKTVKVGWQVYDIVEWDHMQASSAGFMGQTSHLTGQMRLDNMLKRHQVAATLFHEIMHAITNMWTIEDADKEERRIRILEAGISTVWVDNPEVMAWIGRNLQK